MVYAQTNTDNQTIYLSLDEGRQYFATVFTDYLLIITREENSSAGVDLAQVPTIVNENRQATQLIITTFGLTLAGRYRYDVYGQNSNSNLDPSNAAVVGLVERGWMVLTDNQQYFDVPAVTIQDRIINGN